MSLKSGSKLPPFFPSLSLSDDNALAIPRSTGDFTICIMEYEHIIIYLPPNYNHNALSIIKTGASRVQ